MIAGHQVHRYASLRHFNEWPEGFLYQGGRHAAAVQQVTAVHYQVYFPFQGRLEGGAKIGEEILSSPSAFDTRAHGQVESQVSVGQQQQADWRGRHMVMIYKEILEAKLLREV